MPNIDIAKIIDHTNLKANATEDDIRKTCQEAIDFGFRGVCINPRWVKFSKEFLRGTKIKVITVIDWPNGASDTKVRVFQAKIAKEDGADEIDPVLRMGDFKMKNYDIVLEDLKKLAEVLPTKVIIETGYLDDNEIEIASKLVKESGAYCVKTSTGVPPKVDIDTKVKHIEIMRKAVPDLKIKAAGGIRTYKDAEKVISAGADIIGSSSGVEIVESMKRR